MNIDQIIEKDEEGCVPLVELLGIAITGIFGSEDGLDDFLECYKDVDCYGIVTHHYDERVGFSLAFEKGWKEFRLTIGDQSDMKIDQLQLFDQLREWGFNI